MGGAVGKGKGMKKCNSKKEKRRKGRKKKRRKGRKREEKGKEIEV